MLKAVTRQATFVDNKIKALNASSGKQITTAYFFDHYATKEDTAVMVTEQDFLEAHKELIPSVSAGELAHYERVRAQFEGGGGKDKDKDKAKANGNGNGNSGQNGRLAVTGGGMAGRRTASGQSIRSMNSSKSAGSKGKGKGKAAAAGSDDEYDHDQEEEGANGGGGYKDKGKGKEVADASPFTTDTGDADEGLYD